MLRKEMKVKDEKSYRLHGSIRYITFGQGDMKQQEK